MARTGRAEAELPTPLQVKQYRKLLLERCLDSLRVATGSRVIVEGMEALTKVLAQLREGDVGSSSFKAISGQCRLFFDNVSVDKSCRIVAIATDAWTGWLASGSCGKSSVALSSRASVLWD